MISADGKIPNFTPFNFISLFIDYGHRRNSSEGLSH